MVNVPLALAFAIVVFIQSEDSGVCVSVSHATATMIMAPETPESCTLAAICRINIYVAAEI